jgi:two-component system, OmpR family, sensor kinase
MTRHFLGLYALLVAILMLASWGQERLSRAYGLARPTEEAALKVAAEIFREQLARQPVERWRASVAELADHSGVSLELYARSEVAGRAILERLDRGAIAQMRGTAGDQWLLVQVSPEYVLALRSNDSEVPRRGVEWLLSLAFYAAIALALMAWLWPLTRDLRGLETAVALFGDRNWSYSAPVSPRSQVHPLATAFEKMARRIDALIASHKDLSNAVAHEIKTPLSRMQFEIELAQSSGDPATVRAHLEHIKTDIAGIDELVKATLAYAFLERAELSLNIARHDFTVLVSATVRAVAQNSRAQLQFAVSVPSDAKAVRCDGHLLELTLRNLLMNAARYARSTIEVLFTASECGYELCVSDDGPGVPLADRQRIFDSFVQLDAARERGRGFGLGLAIVRRAIEWHEGEVSVSTSPLGGVCFTARWPLRSKSTNGSDAQSM